MNWRNPVFRLPKEGDLVWVLYCHGKEHNPRSYEMMCGEVCYGSDGSCKVDTIDYTGKGSWGVYLDSPEPLAKDDAGIAWLPVSEFVLPEWAGHDSHWGEPNT